jgi:hypothetical protein
VLPCAPWQGGGGECVRILFHRVAVFGVRIRRYDKFAAKLRNNLKTHREFAKYFCPRLLVSFILKDFDKMTVLPLHNSKILR